MTTDVERDAFGWPVKPIWPDTEAGKAIVDDYYAADDPRDTVGYSLGARLAEVEREAVAAERARIQAAIEGLPVDIGGILEVSRETVLAILDPDS